MEEEGAGYVHYCQRCGFPAEYCEYNPHCTDQERKPEQKAKAADAKIQILKKRVSGNRHVTIIRNLGMFLPASGFKELSKSISKKMACGSSVVKNGSNTDDIVIQTSDDARVIAILEKTPGVEEARIERPAK